jgi:adenine-specific DNA glycosylase
LLLLPHTTGRFLKRSKKNSKPEEEQQQLLLLQQQQQRLLLQQQQQQVGQGNMFNLPPRGLDGTWEELSDEKSIHKACQQQGLVWDQQQGPVWDQQQGLVSDPSFHLPSLQKTPRLHCGPCTIVNFLVLICRSKRINYLVLI